MPSSPPGHRHGRGLLLLAIVASLSTAVTSVDSRWTRWNCSSLPPSPAPSPSSSSSTTNSTFWSNVVALLDALPSAAAPTGFASLSRGNGADRAFVRGICRGDTSPAHCATYLRSAALGIKSRCSSRRGAIWYDDGSTVTYPAPMMSSISYADTDESTSDEDKYRMIFHNVRVVSDKDAFAFERAYYSLIGLLTARVVNGSATPSPAPMFATGEAVYDSAVPNGTMYGLLQCMRDRTAAECDHCLQNSSQKLPRELYGNQGGVVLGYNCYLRMEIYPFYDLTLDAPPPLAPAPSAFIGQSGGFASLSRGNGTDGAFVRGLCRGDTTPAKCATYLQNAALGIQRRCNSSRRAAIWYDDGSGGAVPAPMFCFVSYADTNTSTASEDAFRQPLTRVNKQRAIRRQL
ncbi:hypothetical protein BAE44_0018890 [Dichanthelium oligosanthes]|uniref:Gnk2-homologous domain-containing protein n=1 Tax=Dichanthelium oligosanthes TaxID=888268 RepID=A0A1E5V4Q9_9POAL|nr:hypothetical protein BAE44_0018890 [Dichanthelium oligosanthes]